MTLPVQDHERPLAGAEKIAAVLLALDREASSRILKHFDTRELREIARTAARLKSVPSVVLEEICAGLVDAIDNGEPDLIGGQMVVESLLSSALPDEQVAAIMSGVRRGSNKFIWQKVGTLPDQLLSDYLAAEHPQMIAVVLGRLDPPVAARILALLPANLRSQAMRRMLIAKPVAEEVLHILEEALQEDLFATAAAPSSSDVSARVAGIVNQLERDQIEQIVTEISEAEPILGQQLKRLIFSFEDIVNLDQRSRMIIFDQAQTERVILALRGSDQAMREAVLPCLSARTRRMVEAELASAADPPRKDVVAAQREIANLVLRLAEQGLVDLNAANSGAAG